MVPLLLTIVGGPAVAATVHNPGSLEIVPSQISFVDLAKKHISVHSVQVIGRVIGIGKPEPMAELMRRDVVHIIVIIVITPRRPCGFTIIVEMIAPVEHCIGTKRRPLWIWTGVTTAVCVSGGYYRLRHTTRVADRADRHVVWV